MNSDISAIARLLDIPAPRHPGHITHLLTDSRSLITPGETLFFALHTPSGDGHNFIADLYARGVRHFVAERLPEDAQAMPEANFLIVNSTLGALQTLGKAIRRELGMPVVGITGSRGKTTVKEWACELLRGSVKVSRSPRSYNSQTGVPLSMWDVRPDSEVAIIEAGISLPGEMDRLAAIIQPTIGVFTSIGGAHSEGFDSIEAKAAEKAKLLQGCETVVYPADNPIISSVIPAAPRRIGWSLTDPDAPLFINGIKKEGGVSEVSYSWMGGSVTGSYRLPFTAGHDIDNSVNALALALLFDIPADTIATRMATLKRVNTRLEVIEGRDGCRLIHDSFTADVPSLTQAIDFAVRRLTPGHGLTLMLGNLISATDDDPAETYAAAAEVSRSRGVKRVITAGDEVSRHTHLFGPDAKGYPTVQALLEDLDNLQLRDTPILIKGAPGSAFDLVNEAMEARRHETVLEINLNAVIDNFNFFRSLIKPTTGIVCMIKASGYGAGAGELAKTLQTQGAAYLAVAVHDEGTQLRQEGITMPIIVLNPMVDDFKTLFDNRLEPEIYSLDFLSKLIAEARRLGIREYPVHIKIDSGMHRLGFLEETLPEAIAMLKGQDYVVPRSIFSHLCAADDPLDDDYTRGQFEYFDRCCRMLLEAFPGRRILRHILNSTGITRFPDHQLDMVRLGIGLYGVRTMHDGSQAALRTVSTLRTVIISVKRWPAGTTIGYNRRGVLKRDSVIATIPIGYADGLNRHLGYGNASFLVGGVLCPTVGSICMDACMIDVTDLPGAAPGMSVEVFGENVRVDTLAETLDTIPYEVLTSVSQRVKRVYYRE